MKKNLLVFIIGVVITCSFAFVSYGQTNLIKNGDFETKGAWNVAQRDLSHPYDVNFGVAASGPDGGSGKFLEVMYDASTGGSGEVEVFITQKVGIIKGHTYSFSAAMEDLSANLSDYWIEIIWVPNKPTDATNINELKAATFGSFGNSAVGFNGLIDTSIAVNNASKIRYPYFNIPDTLSTDTIFFGINIGTWGTTANFDLFFDNVTLFDSASITSVKNLPSKNPDLINVSPNPIKLNGTINYMVIENGNVHLNLYNTLGQKVTSLVNEYKTKGTYNIRFDGSIYKSGIYLVRYELNGVVSTKKLYLQK